MKNKMLRPALRLLALFVLAATLAQASDYDAQFNKWFEVQTNLQSWSGGFTQTRTLTVLNQPLVTMGKVWVKRGEFRWELGDPPQTIVVRRPDELLIIYPRFKRAEKYPLGAAPVGPMKDALALLDASLPRDRASMEEHFRLLSATETNSLLQMTLQPRS
jgi:outer membrane lipoprotein-sorting protein